MEKILIIQTAFIGDAILTLPMIQVLKQKYNDSIINVLCIPSTGDIFLASPYVNEVQVLDKKGKHKSLLELVLFSKEIKKENYTRIFSPHRSFRTALIVMLSGVRETYGFSTAALRHVYKNLVEYRDDHHEVRRNLELAGYSYSGDEWRIPPEINAPEKNLIKIDNYLKNLVIKNNFLAIAPGSIWNTKKYPLEYYENIIHYFVNNSYEIILIGSKKDQEICENIESKFDGKVYSAAGKFTVIESIELLRRSLLLLSNDSAPSHMAMCARIPALTLYCSTVPEFGFYPYIENSSYLSYDDLFCKPCGIHGYEKCPISTFECGYNLKPETVIKKLEEMLNGKNPSS